MSYERLKRALAEQDWADMNHYAQAKGRLIEEILARAGHHNANRFATTNQHSI